LGAASAKIDFTPWLDVGTDIGLDGGFQGDCSYVHVDDDSPQSGLVTRIQEGQDLATGTTVDVEPGTYVENLTITKTLTLLGAGSGANPLVDTIISAANIDLPAIAINASGRSSIDRLSIRDLRATGATNSDGVSVTAPSSSFLTFHNVASVNNANGVHFGAVGGTVSDVEIELCQFSLNGNAGLRVASSMLSTTGVHVTGGTISSNAFVGFNFNPSASASCVGDDLDFDGTTFANNGTSAGVGSGHISYDGFNGSADLKDLTLSGNTGTPVQFRGTGTEGAPGTWSSLGKVTFDNVTISGDTTQPAVFIQAYSSLASVSINDLDLSGVVSTNAPGAAFAVAMQLDHTGEPLPLARTTFRCQGGQSAGFVGLAVVNTSGATADSSTVFVGATTDVEKKNCILDGDDVPGLANVTITGLATWYADVDGDGFGDPTSTATSCTQPSGYVGVAGDGCPLDAKKHAAGICGCGISDADTDLDGTADCNDGCPNDSLKLVPGTCGCGVADTDTDADGMPNCTDGCPTDPTKIAPGECGCGVADVDPDGDGTADCVDGCPSDFSKIAPGARGCGVADLDADGDGSPDCVDLCPADPNKSVPGVCGYGTRDADADGDGVADCLDVCPGYPDNVDCNSNGTPDGCDIHGIDVLPGTSGDINRNEIPDECECLGDLNIDGVVDAADLAILLGQSGFAGSADLDANGAVDAADLAILIGQLGTLPVLTRTLSTAWAAQATTVLQGASLLTAPPSSPASERTALNPRNRVPDSAIAWYVHHGWQQQLGPERLSPAGLRVTARNLRDVIDQSSGEGCVQKAFIPARLSHVELSFVPISR